MLGLSVSALIGSWILAAVGGGLVVYSFYGWHKGEPHD
jgi:hypothetical protein